MIFLLINLVYELYRIVNQTQRLKTILELHIFNLYYFKNVVVYNISDLFSKTCLDDLKSVKWRLGIF